MMFFFLMVFKLTTGFLEDLPCQQGLMHMTLLSSKALSHFCITCLGLYSLDVVAPTFTPQDATIAAF